MIAFLTEEMNVSNREIIAGFEHRPRLCRNSGMWAGRASPRRIDQAVSIWNCSAIDGLEQFQEKCERVFRPELRKNKELEQYAVFVKR
ncbi:hypothetical protein [Mesorhizobium sp. NZP2077]|uniref:hypothetical protein n=1 Tax=Mesorhizobium sp. NZP2077 TaxID=2483404 RepID=UPI001552AF60|nr:hypothetical protein [Mesorhizobium sp. NZP2077]QKC85329.1 hypothetical protein EB232_30565 [Mesorhizobium sp. NZP2077]QKD18971.1 hypothetical protein HGP13_30265 [Mesorhizobium sp. NZP2077]